MFHYGRLPYQVAFWPMQPFGHNRRGPKIEGSAPFWGGELGSPFNTKSPGLRATSTSSGMLIHAVIWQQIWAENWGLCPVGGGGAESPSNTMWPEPRPTCVPCFILNRPTVGHRAPTSQTDRINRTDRQTERRTGQRSDGRGRTVLQTVDQKR